ncbi:MAG TPA: peptidase domain-containing ABC transporter [Noviherbaspirillum sp.]
MVMQTEAAECGLACIAMIAQYHGSTRDLRSIRAKEGARLRGANLIMLILAAGRINLRARALRLELSELKDLQTPCVLHWDMAHFVVLKEVSGNRVTIHDPALGAREFSLEEVSKHFTGVALELEPTPDFETGEPVDRLRLRDVIGRVRGATQAFIQIFLLALVLEGLIVVAPFQMQWTIDQVLLTRDADLSMVLAIGFAFLLLFQILVSGLRSWAITHLGALLSVQWVTNIFAHMVHLPLRYFAARHVGDVVSRIDSVRSIQRVITTQFVGALIDGLMSMTLLVLMALYSPMLLTVVLSAFAVYFVSLWVLYKPHRRATQDLILSSAVQNSALIEVLRAMPTLKLANQLEARVNTYQNGQVEVANRDIRTQVWALVQQHANQFVFGFQRVLIIWMGARAVMANDMSVGMLVAFLAYADLFAARAAKLVEQLKELRMLSLHVERLADVTQTPREPHQWSDMDSTTLPNRIELRDVGFRYGENDPWIFRNLNLSVEGGESVAIVGPSGCGKSTLAKIILGLEMPTEGEVLYGGIEIRKLGLKRYRQIISAVLQDDVLMAGTIADNITLEQPGCTEEAIRTVAQMAEIDADILAMPMQYRTEVGDMGSALSGGQRQRLILARALFRAPRVLLLDEATSHLDEACEQRVNENIRGMSLTRIIIAHRPATIASASRIINLGIE